MPTKIHLKNPSTPNPHDLFLCPLPPFSPPKSAWWKLRLHQRGVRRLARLQPPQGRRAVLEAHRDHGEAARLQLGAEQLRVRGDLLQGDLQWLRVYENLQISTYDYICRGTSAMSFFLVDSLSK